MPTGYTSDLYEGKDLELKDFVYTVAPGFGAFIHHRDDDGPIKLRRPTMSTDEQESYEKHVRELNEWNDLDDGERREQYEAYLTETTEYREKELARQAGIEKRYRSMLEKVKGVNPPPELENFNNFMIEQLESSIKFDCGYSDYLTTPLQSFDEWCADKEETLHRMVYSYKKYVAEAEQRHEQANAWIDKLVEVYGLEIEE